MKQQFWKLGPRQAAFLCGAAIALGSACGGLDRRVESRVTITQGVYGQMIRGCDTMGCVDEVMPGATVGLFPSSPQMLDGGTPPAPLALTTSKEQGFYELAVDAGRYFIAAGDSLPDGGMRPWSSSREVDVPQGKVRWDFASGPGGGIWESRTP